MLDLQVEDGELDDRQQADVGAVDDVGDVAVREDVARLAAEDGGLGDTRVGAAQPEDGRRLAFGALVQELGVILLDIGGPLPVGLEGVLKCVTCCASHGCQQDLHCPLAAEVER